MQTNSGQKRDLAAATRGLIVQRVLVEGRTPAEAGAPFGVDGRTVAHWVACYKLHGMAALRGQDAVGSAPRRWIRRGLARIGAWVRGGGAARRSVMWPADGGDAATRRWR